MSDKIIDLAQAKEERSPHREGPALCLQCKHEWQAVMPGSDSDTDELQCPKCLTYRGVWQGHVMPEGASWRCKCGCFQFMLAYGYAHCLYCGNRHDFDDLVE